MDERIRIVFEAIGAEALITDVEHLQQMLGGLRGKKLKIAVDNSLKQIRGDIQKLSNVKAEINFKKNTEFDRFQRQIDAITKKKHELQFDFNKANRQIAQIQKRVAEGLTSSAVGNRVIDRINADLYKKWGFNANFDEFTRAMLKEQDKINSIADERTEAGYKYADDMRKAQQETINLKKALQEIKEMDITPHFNVQQMYSAIRNFQMRLGSAMQSVGNGLTRLTSPLDSLLRGTLYTAAYKGINAITEGLSGATERYDIMERYPDIISAMGGSATVAKGEIQKLYQAVLGLPTGLDTIVDAQKQYFLALQGGYKDQNKALKKASDIAIAANNAFVAGGASEEQIIFGQRQLRDLLSAGKLRNQEWQSLAKAIPNAMSAIQKDLGVTRSDIMSGQVAAEDFIESLLKVASAGGPVAQAAEKMKHTFTAVQSNIRNALRNAGYEGIKALDQILMAYNGKDVIDNLLGIKPFIQDVAKDIQEWAKANPDKIVEFFEKIKSIDIKGFLAGMASAFGNLIKLLGSVTNIFDGLGGASLGKMLVYANFLGKFLRSLGGIIRGTAGANAGFLTGLAFLGSRLVNFFKSTNTASKVAKISAVDKLRNFFARFKTVEKAATDTAGTGGFKAVNRKLAKTGAEATELATTTATMSTSLKQVGANILKSIAPAITIGAYIGVFWGAVKAIENISKSDINFDKLIANLTYTATGIASIMGVMRLITNVAFRGTLGTAVVTAIKDLVANISMLITAGTFTTITKLTSIISQIRINPDRMAHNLENVMLALSAMMVFTTGIGALYVVPIGGQVLALMNVIGDLAVLFTAGTWLTVTQALEKISKLDVPDTTKVGQIIDAIENMREALLKKRWWENWGDAIESSDVKDTMDNLKAISDSMVGIVTNFGTILTNIQGLESKGVTEEQIKNASATIKSLKNGIWELFGAVDDFFKEEKGKQNAENMSRSYWSEGDSSKRFEGFNEALKSTTQALSEIQRVASQVMKLQGVMNKLKAQFGTFDVSDTWLHDPIGMAGKGEGQINTNPITQMIGGFVQMINAITNSENGLGALQNAVKRMEGINLDNIKAQLDKIPQLMDTLTQLKNKLSMNTWMTQGYETPTLTGGFVGGAVGSTPTQMGEQTTFTGAVGEMLTTIKKFVEVMVQIGNELDKVPDITTNAENLKKGVNTVKSAVTAMSALKNAIAADSENGTSIESVATSISGYINNLNTALANAGQMLFNAQTFKLATDTIKLALESITSGEGGSINAFIDGLKKIPGALNLVNNAMANRGTTWKNNIVDGFKGTAEAVKAEVDKIATNLSGLDYESQGRTAGSSFARGFNNGLSAIRTSIAAPTVRTPWWAIHSVGGDRSHTKTGGLITKNGVKYMRKGGMVNGIFPGRPKGIDRIPIWAADGEYMMKRRAVSAFGTKFMRRINNLDLKGAIATLGMKGGQLAYATPTTVIDRSKHITYNNNQRLTMNNNNASQGYSEIRASQFLRKL